MRVQDGHPSMVHALAAVKRGRHARSETSQPSAATTTEAPAQAPTGVTGTAENVQAPAEVKSEKQRGVIRLLANDHFKGVANLRLRMRFASELEAAGVAPLDVSQLDVSSHPGRAYARLVEAYTALHAPAPEDAPVAEVPVEDVPVEDVPTTDVPTADVPMVEVPMVEVPMVEVPMDLQVEDMLVEELLVDAQTDETAPDSDESSDAATSMPETVDLFV